MSTSAVFVGDKTPRWSQRKASLQTDVLRVIQRVVLHITKSHVTTGHHIFTDDSCKSLILSGPFDKTSSFLIHLCLPPFCNQNFYQSSCQTLPHFSLWDLQCKHCVSQTKDKNKTCRQVWWWWHAHAWLLLFRPVSISLYVCVLQEFVVHLTLSHCPATVTATRRRRQGWSPPQYSLFRPMSPERPGSGWSRS